MLRLAISKGRVGKQAIAYLSAAGLVFPDTYGRQLQIEDQTGSVAVVFVKSADVPTYVAEGVADIGIVGKDVLEESALDYYELLDMELGKCNLCLAGYPNESYEQRHHMRIATKYPVQTAQWLSEQGKSGQIIKLDGSVELGPIVGLSDYIVDIVETGATLRENNLCVLEVIRNISTRLITNQVLYKTKHKEISALVQRLRIVKETYV